MKYVIRFKGETINQALGDEYKRFNTIKIASAEALHIRDGEKFQILNENGEVVLDWSKECTL